MSAASGAGPRRSGSWCDGSGPRGATRGPPSLRGKIEVEVHLPWVEAVGVEQPPHVKPLQRPGRQFMDEGVDELQLGGQLLLFVLGLELEQPRQATIPGGLHGATHAGQLDLEGVGAPTAAP